LDIVVVLQVDRHLEATQPRTPAQQALQQELVRLSTALRARQRPPPGPQALVLCLNGCLPIGDPRRFVPGQIQCAMEFVELALSFLRLEPQYLVSYEQRARCHVCQADRAQVKKHITK
jgi:hypothetical protein